MPTHTYISYIMPNEDSELARERVETSISELSEWLANNFLMLNDDKTICLAIGSHFKDPPHLSNLTIGNTEFTKNNSAHNLGVPVILIKL